MRSERILAVTIALFLAALLTLPLDNARGEEPASGEAVPEFNRMVLRLVREYPADGTHRYWWPRSGEGNYDGCTRDLFLLGQRVMRGEAEGRTYCCGVTLEVFLRAYQEWLAGHGGEQATRVRPEEWSRFQKLWFVLKQNGPGPSAALEAFDLGRTIPREEALPGDFVQIWRTKNAAGKMTGHSVIFLDWVRDEAGRITGFRYWSSQPATNGIGERVEHFGPDGGMSEEYTYFGRVEPQGADDQAP